MKAGLTRLLVFAAAVSISVEALAQRVAPVRPRPVTPGVGGTPLTLPGIPDLSVPTLDLPAPVVPTPPPAAVEPAHRPAACPEGPPCPDTQNSNRP
jgi:hypothetical protein